MANLAVLKLDSDAVIPMTADWVAELNNQNTEIGKVYAVYMRVASEKTAANRGNKQAVIDAYNNAIEHLPLNTEVTVASNVKHDDLNFIHLNSRTDDGWSVKLAFQVGALRKMSHENQALPIGELCHQLAKANNLAKQRELVNHANFYILRNDDMTVLMKPDGAIVCKLLREDGKLKLAIPILNQAGIPQELVSKVYNEVIKLCVINTSTCNNFFEKYLDKVKLPEEVLSELNKYSGTLYAVTEFKTLEDDLRGIAEQLETSKIAWLDGRGENACLKTVHMGGVCVKTEITRTKKRGKYIFKPFWENMLGRKLKLSIKFSDDEDDFEIVEQLGTAGWNRPMHVGEFTTAMYADRILLPPKDADANKILGAISWLHVSKPRLEWEKQRFHTVVNIIAMITGLSTFLSLAGIWHAVTSLSVTEWHIDDIILSLFGFIICSMTIWAAHACSLISSHWEVYPSYYIKTWKKLFLTKGPAKGLENGVRPFDEI